MQHRTDSDHPAQAAGSRLVKIHRYIIPATERLTRGGGTIFGLGEGRGAD